MRFSRWLWPCSGTTVKFILNLPVMNDSVIVVTPGETIARESGTFSFIRGHGTYTVTNTLRATQFGAGISNIEDEDADDQVEEVSLVASVGGVLERVNKLVTAKPIHTRCVGPAAAFVRRKRTPSNINVLLTPRADIAFC